MVENRNKKNNKQVKENIMVNKMKRQLVYRRFHWRLSTGDCSQIGHGVSFYWQSFYWRLVYWQSFYWRLVYGYWSTGNRSTGDWSTSNYSTGHSQIDDTGFSAFNKLCNRDQWAQADIPSWLYFNLTEWVDKEDMTDLEKQDHPTYETTGGYLKVYEYQEAWKKSYDNATREEQLKIKSLPNFDAEVFYEISGIKIDEGLSNPKEITIEGATYRLVEEVSNG
jgi:hypothetical protein